MSYGTSLADMHRQVGVYKPHPQGREACRPACGSVGQVRAGHQRLDRQDARPYRAADSARHRGRRDRVDGLFAAPDRPRSAPWTRQKDNQLLRLQAKGLSAGQIADQLGTTRSAVLGRSARLRDTVFPSQTRQAERDKALRMRRREQNNHRDKTAVTAMRRAIAKGVDRDQAIISAVRARATYQAIADELGVSRQRVRQIVAPVLGYRTPSAGRAFGAARNSDYGASPVQSALRRDRAARDDPRRCCPDAALIRVSSGRGDRGLLRQLEPAHRDF
jgi:hypothetical protein